MSLSIHCQELEQLSAELAIAIFKHDYILADKLATERLTLLDLLLIESKVTGLPFAEEQKKIVVAILNKEKKLLADLEQDKKLLEKEIRNIKSAEKAKVIYNKNCK